MSRLAKSATVAFALAALPLIARGEDAPQPAPPAPATTQPTATPPLSTTATGKPTPDQPAPTAVQPPPAAKVQRGVAAAQQVDKPFSFLGSLSAGYDSNVALLPADNPLVTNTEAGSISLAAKATWHAIAKPSNHLNLSLLGGLDDYPGNETFRMIRYGALMTDQWLAGGAEPIVTLALNQFMLDGDNAATVANAGYYHTVLRPDWVAIPGIELQYRHYNQNDAATGTLADLSYRHWFLHDPNNHKRLLELGLMAGYYFAKEDFESYFVIRPDIGVSYRFGEQQVRGTIDVGAKLMIEYRDYKDAVAAGTDTEHQLWFILSASGDYWLGEHWSAGLYGRYTNRDSNLNSRDFDRIQVGARTIFTW